MTAGKRDALVTFQRATSTQNEYGEEIATWGDLGEEWAQVFYGRGDERRQAAMEQGHLPATFEVPDNTLTRSLTLMDRISFDEGIWDIVANIPSTRTRGDREVTAKRAT